MPKVSWLLLGVEENEHPGFSNPHAGELGAREVLGQLVSHPDIWRKTALFVTWDENGGSITSDHRLHPGAPQANT